MATLDCTNIELELIRARIVINDTLTIETPDVKSFSVNKSRASNIGTFSANVELPANVSASIGSSLGLIKIFAGTKQNYITKGPIFTGIIRRMSPQPVLGKPNYFLLSISGDDIMSKLQNKKYSRRISTEGPGLFCTINGPVGPRPTSLTWSIDKRIGSGTHTYSSTKPDLDDRKEHNSNIKYDSHGKGTGQGAWLSGKASEIVPEPIGGGQGGVLTIHDHATVSRGGGPAFSTYSIK